MNSIYKVIWSKAKNCYVVASEIARSHTKSATGSEKIGGVTRRSLLASLMALSLLCGGLGVASAADVVHVDESATGTAEVYTTAKVDTLLNDKADETAVTTALDGKANTSLNNLDDAGKSVIKTTMADELAKKADATALDGKANTSLDNLSDAGKSVIKDTMAGELAKKADATALDTKADKATTLAGYGITDAYTKADVDNAVAGAVATAGTNVDAKLADYAKTADVDTKLAGKADKATTLAGYGITDAYTKGDVDTRLNEKADKKALTQATDRITANETTIAGLTTKTTKITYDAALGTSVDGVTFNAGAVTGVKSINGTEIGTKESGSYISQDDSIWGNMKKVDTQVKTNADNIETNKNDITKLDAKVGTVGTGTYLDPTKSVGDNLGLLDAGLKKEVDDRTVAVDAEKAAREEADNKLSDRIGTVAEDGNYIEKSDTKNVSENLKVLDTRAKTNADAIAKETADRRAAIGELAVNGNYIEKDKNVSDNLVKLDNQAKANADAITETNQRTAGITRDDTRKETSIEGKVTVDTNGNIKAEGTITSNGVNAGDGEIKTTGKVSAGDVSTGTLETTGNAKIGGDLTVDGKLNVGEISMKNDKLDTHGNKHDSTTTITADGISNDAKVTDKNGVTTESKFTHDKEGSTTYAKKGDATDWKEATSNVTADGVENIAKDSKGNTSTTRQDGKGIYGYAKDKDGNKSYTKQEGNRIAESVIGQDGKETKSEMTSTDITNTAKDGTITSDAKDIVNKATGNISNSSATMDTTVTGKATESYGELETEVKGNEKHTVKGDQTNEVDGKQINTIKNGQENIISGGQTNTITGGQINNITGDQTTNVSGTQTTTATDINRNASSSMVDKVDNAYGTNTETKEAGKTTTDVSIKGTGEEGKYIRGANESRDYLIKGTLKNSETKTAEATSTEITDGNGKTSATIQDVNNLAGSVTNGTETGVSGIHAKDNSVSIDSIVTDGNKYSVINQKKGSIQSTVVDGTNSTVILQDKDNVTIASSNGTVGIVGKDIVNNAQNTITNTAGTSITNQVKDSKVTTDANGTTFENNTPAVSDGGATTTKINGNQITTGRVDANELGVSDKDGTNTADLSVKAGEGVKASAGNGTTTGSLDVKADEVKTEVKDDSTGNRTNTSQTADGIKGYATDKDGNKTSTKVTATENSFQVQDKDGKNKNHQVNTKDSSENTITNGDKTNTVTSTADGTTFNNSKANTAFEGGTYTDTTIKGNTITTGKVTMDYAEVMKDLGVHGNANITGKTTTGSLEVTGTTNLKDTNVGGKLDVTGKATFSDDVDIKKNLSVVGDVTANSYKVGDKTYIDKNGIHANGQKITDVADGSISEGSKDAVNGGQLYTVKNDLEGKVNKVGANAAAMANLHPMEFDPDSKWNIAAAIGNYGSETAAALGAFYRPNDDVMVNLSTAFGTGENMVGGGVSVRLGQGGNKLSREESNQLKAQVADLTARMDALLSVLNPNMSKDFPDVPENHWAYEAVSRLAGNDIVQGYPDGEFHGERTMTRYEMAEIIYNALSRGAEAEKELVEEFKPELQAMAASEKATAEKAEG